MRDWATGRRRHWSGARIAAALALHVLLLASLTLAIDRIDMPRRGTDRATTLVTIILHAPPPPLHATPLPPPKSAHTPLAVARVPLPARPRDTDSQLIALPAPPAPVATAVTPPASAPMPGPDFLDSAATRRAILDAARGQTLATLGNAITSTGQTSSERLAKGVEAAHKADCMKEAGGMGLLALPVLLAAEAMGKCAHKL